MSKFDKVPVEKDTAVLRRLEVRYGEYECLYEQWHWESVEGESLIFIEEQVGDLPDEELVDMVRQANLLKEGSSCTVKRNSNGYAFVNFNFETT